MIRSMTGFGRAEGPVAGRRLAVEIKTVNHRFLNFFSRVPGDIQRFEGQVLALVKARLQRGQVNVFAAWDGGGAGGPAVTVDLEAARRAADALRRVAEVAGVEPAVTLDHLLAFPAVTAAPTAGLDPDAFWAELEPLFRTALEDLDGFRVREGADLAADVSDRLAELDALVDRVEARRPEVVREYRERLARRVRDLAEEVPSELLDERVAVEVAVMADRSDVSEEIVRLRSHLAKFRELLDRGGVVGRKLDFVLQEMNRETNTIGSKASDAVVGEAVVEIKAELEKIREQIQNVE